MGNTNLNDFRHFVWICIRSIIVKNHNNAVDLSNGIPYDDKSKY